MHLKTLHTLAILVLFFGQNASSRLYQPGETLGPDTSGMRSESSVETPLDNISALAAGESHTCALTATGEVRCWGTYIASTADGDWVIEPSSVPVPVAGVTSNVTAISSGYHHTCVLTTNGGVKCWGNNWYGQLGNGTTDPADSVVDVVGLTSGVIAIDTGHYYSCAVLSSGKAKCWGSNSFGQLGDGTDINRPSPVEVVGLTNVTQITAGENFTCALQNGGAKCWGSNSLSQLGNGTIIDRKTPVDVTGLTSGVVRLNAGSFHACAITTANGLKCWGYNYSGQVGDGSTTDRSVPVDVIGLGAGVSIVDGGRFHTCAVTALGEVKCWGSNYARELGIGNTTEQTSPVTVSGFSSGGAGVAAGSDHTCALTTQGKVKCWGDNIKNQLGTGMVNLRAIPMNISLSDYEATFLSAGRFLDHTCAVLNSGVKCWGAGIFNHSLAPSDRISIPTDIPGLTHEMNLVRSGGGFTCVLSDAGAVQCWGKNAVGQLGNGTFVLSKTPVNVIGLDSGVVSLATGDNHTCVLTNTGAVKCWGGNSYGQLGDSSKINRNTPVDVTGLSSGVISISTKGDYTCALTDVGGIKCWGNNSFGQLGDSTTVNRSAPVDVTGLTSGVTTVLAIGDRTCAITDAGGLKCWGANSRGQIGDNTIENRSAPVDVVGLSSGVASISGSPYYTCALTDAGGAKCWGDNSYGQLGDGTTSERHAPVDVISLTSDVATITVSTSHTCAILNNGAAKCWGANLYGQLGDGTLIDRSCPVDVQGLSEGTLSLNIAMTHSCAIVNGGKVKCWGSDKYGQLGLMTQIWSALPADVVTSIEPVILLSQSAGQPGSFFTLTGQNFAPNTQVALSVNSAVLSSAVPVNATGGFIVFLGTSDADEGFYEVAADTTHATFFLSNRYPARVKEGGGILYSLPAGIPMEYHSVYLPLLR